MKRILLSFALFTASLQISFSQSKTQIVNVSNLFKDTKEIYFEFDYSSKTQLSELSKIISIDHGTTATKAKAYANQKEFTQFLTYNIPYTLLLRPNQTANVKMLKDGEGVKSLRSAVGAYPTYPQYISMMQQFAIDYPSICTYYDLGTLPSGRKIVILKISDNPALHENEPAFLYTSTMHGDETTGYPMLLSLIDNLLSNYGTDTRLTNLVNQMEIWINPLANPDGTYAAGDLTVSGATRYNANAVDLNRNYPDPQDGLHPDGNSYQPETQIFMGLADTMDFVMSANFHGGAEVANFPWDTWNHVHPDQAWWIQQCTNYADTAQLHGSAGYMDDLYSGSIAGVTNGFAWYEVDGGRQDFMQWWHQCREFTVELSTTKLLADAQLINYYNYNVRSLLNYMESSLYGIRGVITDNCTGQPMRAKVFISGHDADSSFVYSSGDVGNYHRPILPGTYNVTYSAPGYISQTISGVNVASASSTTIVNVSLAPAPPVANFISSSAAGCTGTIDFTDLTGSATSWAWDFGDGNTSTTQNPSHTYASSGTYTVTLTTTNCAGTDAEIKLNYLTLTVAAAPSALNDTTTGCTPMAFNLTASGSGTLNWYDAPVGGTLVNVGTSYTTPVLSSTTTYYVESSSTGGTAAVGPVDNTIGAGGYFTGASSHYEVFDAFQPFTLVSVKVYANTTGSRTIQLRNSSGTVLQSLTTTLPSGMSIVTLNFNVPAGTDMQLGISGTGGNLYRNSAGAAYPYTLAGVASIKRSSAAPPNDLIYYYFFYDWQVTTNCNSARTAVSAVFTNPIGVASVMASTPDNSVCSGTPVTFTATPTNGGLTPSYQWQVNGSNVGTDSPSYTDAGLSNGDIVTCIMTSSSTCVTGSPATSSSTTMTVFALPSTPTISATGVSLSSTATTGNQWYLNGSPIAAATGANYTAVSNGTYTVVVTDGNGCTSDTSNAIVISTVGMKELTEMAFTLFPNPAQNEFTIETTMDGIYTLTVIDNLGQKVIVEPCSTQRKTIDITALKHGMYFVQLKGNNGTITKKLIVK